MISIEYICHKSTLKSALLSLIGLINNPINCLTIFHHISYSLKNIPGLTHRNYFNKVHDSEHKLKYQGSLDTFSCTYLQKISYFEDILLLKVVVWNWLGQRFKVVFMLSLQILWNACPSQHLNLAVIIQTHAKTVKYLLQRLTDCHQNPIFVKTNRTAFIDLFRGWVFTQRTHDETNADFVSHPVGFALFDPFPILDNCSVNGFISNALAIAKRKGRAEVQVADANPYARSKIGWLFLLCVLPNNKLEEVVTLDDGSLEEGCRMSKIANNFAATTDCYVWGFNQDLFKREGQSWLS